MNFPVEEKLDYLPFDKISWKKFEKISTDLLSEFGGEIQAREYLNPGNDQEGIDAYAFSIKDGLYTCLQCKNEKAFGPDKIKKAVQRFLSGKYKLISNRFILCTQIDLGNKKCEEEIHNQRLILKAINNIDLIIWDSKELNRQLKKHPRIVYDAFDINAVTKFNGIEYTKNYFESQRETQSPPKKLVYTEIPDYIQRSVSTINIRDFINQETKTFCELISDGNAINKHYLLLDDGGNGKSVELSHVAQHFSLPGNDLFPVKIELRDYTQNITIDELICSKCADWRNVESQKLVLIFDGLDEMSENGYIDFIKKMNVFAGSSTESKENKSKATINAVIILSCRTNFYDLQKSDGQLRNFIVLKLNPLSQADIKRYTEFIIGARSAAFLKLMENRDLEELLYSPFYLKELVKIYSQKENGELFPNTKSGIIAAIINQTFEADSVKFALELNNNEIGRERKLEIVKLLAFSMAQLGVNKIKKNDIKNFITTKTERDILRFFSVLKSENDSYQFSHNLIQEYLSATCLINVEIESVIDIISYQPDLKKIKNKWYNPLSFYILLKDNHQNRALIEWLINNEPEVIINIEPDKLNSQTRFSIFTGIINKYKNKGIYIPYNYFSISKFAKFSGGGVDIILYLIDEIENGTQFECRLYCINIIKEFSNYFGLETRIKQILMLCACDKTSKIEIQAKSIEALIKLNHVMSIDEVYDILIKENPNIFERDVRRAMYLLIDTQLPNSKFIRFVLDAIPIINKTNGNFDLSYELQCIEKILSCHKHSDDIITILKFMRAKPEIFRSHGTTITFSIDFLGKFLANCASGYLTDKKIFKPTIELLHSLIKTYCNESIIKLFTDFFIVTNTKKSAFNFFYIESQRTTNNIHILEYLGFLCDWNVLLRIYKDHEKGIVSSDYIRGIRYAVSHAGQQDLHDKFHNYINGKSKKEYDYQPQIDWDKLRSSQNCIDQALLLDRTFFLVQLKNTFNRLGHDWIKKENLNIHYFDLRKELDNTIIVSLLQTWAIEHSEVDYNVIKNHFENSMNWEMYVIYTTHKMIESKTEITEQLKALTISYLKRYLTTIDIRNCIRDKEEGGYYYNEFLAALNDFNYAWDLNWSNEILLDLLHTDTFGYIKEDKIQSKRPFNFISKKIEDHSILKKRILYNLKTNLARPILASHFKMCEILNISEATHFIYNELMNDRVSINDKIYFLEIYLNLGGEKSHLLSVFQNYKGFDYWIEHLGDVLVTEDGEIVCNKFIDIIKENKDLEIIRKPLIILIQCGKIEGIKYLCEYIAFNRKSPIETYNLGNLNTRGLNIGESFSYLFDTLVFTFDTNNKTPDIRPFESAEETVINLINFIALTSDVSYVLALKMYKDFIEKNESNYPNVKNLNYTILSLEREYYKKRQDNIRIQDVVNVNKRLALM